MPQAGARGGKRTPPTVLAIKIQSKQNPKQNGRPLPPTTLLSTRSHHPPPPPFHPTPTHPPTHPPTSTHTQFVPRTQTASRRSVLPVVRSERRAVVVVLLLLIQHNMVQCVFCKLSAHSADTTHDTTQNGTREQYYVMCSSRSSSILSK
jgi:hypothetical protein